MTTPTDHEVDVDLRLDGFDPTEEWPEYSHESLRTAYRLGYAAAEEKAKERQ